MTEGKEMEDAEESLRKLMCGDEEELNEWENWFFKENIRLAALFSELEEKREQFEAEKKQFEAEQKQSEAEQKQSAEENARIAHSMEIDRKRLEQENLFFDQKMKILQSGFEQLDADRRRFEKEKDKFDAKREAYDETQVFYQRSEVTEMLFRGVNSFLALKKRYKDLIKMFHPDNVAGDHEMVQLVNREYEELKKAYEVGKNA